MTNALVTGSNRGIGLQLCKRLAERGAEVWAACRRSSKELEALKVHVVPEVDVTSDEAVSRLAQQLEGKQLDIVVLNAGILRSDSLDRLDFEDIRAQLEVNALGPLRLAAALRKSLHKGSKIGIITSRMGSIADNGSGGAYGYRMSKAAVNAAGVSLARDLKEEGVAVAIIHPGFVKTDMTGGRGNVEPADAAAGIVERIDKDLTLQTSGTFWHQNGEELPW